ncbi:amidohydrolase family protein [Paralcaligenes ginsengisoli]
MRVIDFRLRPPFGGFLDMVMYADIDRSAAMARKLGLQLAPSALAKSMEKLLSEMDEARIEKAVVPGRMSTVLGTVKNEDVADVVGRYPDRFLGFTSIDPTVWKQAIGVIESMLKKGMKGVVIEPGLLPNPMHIDDARIYPVYAFCEERKLPVLLMAGGNAGPDCTYTAPEHIDRVARDFPTLRLISGHGNWPWAAQIIHVCYRRPNIYLSPDMYLYNGMPGAREYIEAANGFMSDRFLFGTAYPVMPLQGSIDSFLALGVKESVIDRVMYANAAELLDITV